MFTDPAAAVEIVQFLLDCDPNVASQTLFELSPLLTVCALESTGFNVAPIMSVILKILHLLYDAHPEAIEDNRIEAVIDSFPEEIKAFVNTHLTYAHQARDSTLMSTRDENGQLPLHRALQDDVTLGSINLLVKGNPSAILIPDNDGALPLHVAVQCHNSTKVVDYLVGLDPNTLTAGCG